MGAACRSSRRRASPISRAARIGGISVLALLVLPLSAIAAVVLGRTVYGRSVLAVGQNMRAARLAGISVGRVRWLTYTLCGGLGGPVRRVSCWIHGRLFARCRRGIPSHLDRGGGDRRHVGRGRDGECSRPLGRGADAVHDKHAVEESGLGVGARDLLTGLIIITVITLAGGNARQGTAKGDARKGKATFCEQKVAKKLYQSGSCWFQCHRPSAFFKKRPLPRS